MKARHTPHPNFYASGGYLDEDENEYFTLLCRDCGREYRCYCADVAWDESQVLDADALCCESALKPDYLSVKP